MIKHIVQVDTGDDTALYGHQGLGDSVSDTSSKDGPEGMLGQLCDWLWATIDEL